MDCVAVVMAAGTGERHGGATPKQYRLLAGKPLIWHALSAFARHPRVHAVLPVIHQAHGELFAAAAAGLDLLAPVVGGASRQDSVRKGLESLSERAPDRVLIHDAARPRVGEDLIARVIAALDAAPAVLPALPVTDTLKRAAGTQVTGTVERAGLYRAQTPQGFAFGPILEAHRRLAHVAVTDDTALAEATGLSVTIVPGEETNMKVTTEDDLRRVALPDGASETRTGLGFDVHRFGPGTAVMLCGVAVPHDRALEGHSDADVALHAVTDALLGAIGAGDIGLHFPPTDPRWRGAPSDTFVGHALDLLASRGGVLVNVDLTVICERPRLGPHRDALVRNLARILRTTEDRIGVKATTTERLGFTGRSEGIAAQAVATVRLPSEDPI